MPDLRIVTDNPEPLDRLPLPSLTAPLILFLAAAAALLVMVPLLIGWVR